MTRLLFRDDPYAREADSRLVALTPEGGLVPEETLFYPTGGGQPGDSGRIEWDGGAATIVTAVKGEGDSVVLVPEEGASLPRPGERILQILDWERRHRHMRVHTALHLLTVVLPYPVTGGSIGDGKGRLDFAMPDPIEDKASVESALQALIDRDLPVTEDWITDAELAANPGLVKTMSVQPPSGQGRVRLIRIGSREAQVDLQPCGGTHVTRTSEIGRVSLGKVEKKGAANRRVGILLVD